MKERITQEQAYKFQPQLLKSLIPLGDAAAKEIGATLTHLMKLRASQINGCAYCQYLHVNEARKDGEAQDRLDLLVAWREVPVFSDRERAALAWTEALTYLRQDDSVERAYDSVAMHFTAAEIVNLSTIITTINAWNRISVGFHFLPK